MKSARPRALALIFFLSLVLGGVGRSDVAVHPSILDPRTGTEAWNVIRLSMQNATRLLDEDRLAEIPNHVSFCSPSLRLLARTPSTTEGLEQVDELTKRAFVSVNAAVLSAQQNNSVGVKSALESLSAILDKIATHFDPKVVKGEVFVCPVHAEIVSENAAGQCAKCNSNLITRRIPYSFIYTEPGAPTIKLTATTSGPIEAGKTIEVKVQMTKPDKSPLLHEDLVETHTKPIHLLIEEPGLDDYHREHPLPTKTPGEYSFSFTPKKTAPYRIWADLVPKATGVEERPFVDLPSDGKADPPANTEDRFTSTVGGFQFAITLVGGNHVPIKAKQARRMAITITTGDGKPVTTLEPFMNAFAHLVGFYGDHETVIHLHPTGGDILNPELRGGPSLGFVLFPPKAGFIRLYCQILVQGKILFAPFNVNVQS